MVGQAQRDGFLAALTGLGGSAGHGKLREALGWDEGTYDEVKQVLIDAGAIVPGRGRGGSVAIAAEGGALPAAAQAAQVDRQVRTARPNTSAANVGYEAELWRMADALRGSMDAAEYKHVVLGLIFLKYISDAFEEMHANLEAEEDQGADPEDPDEYRAENIFWVPPEARWAHLRAQARQSTIGQLVDDAMTGIERDNSALKGVLPKDYARPALDKTRLGQLIDLISNIKVGDAEARAKDVLGRVYEYFLSQFASAEGKKGGEFYTPRCVVKLLVEMLEPYRGRVYDPCCGSSGMFVLATAVAQAVFASLPGIDLWVSALFFDPERGFWMRGEPGLNLIRNVLRASIWVVGLSALAMGLVAFFRGLPLRLGSRPWFYICACLVLGPGLLVDMVLKDHWGRARPADIMEFGGAAHFTPAFQISDQCVRNCSFTSGEAASVGMTAMVLIVLAWPRASRSTRVALVGIFGAVAAGAGTLRIMMGRHFLSDVVFSVLFCTLVLVGLYRVMGMRSFIGVTLRDFHVDVRTMLPRRKVSKNIQMGQEPQGAQLAAASRSTTEPTRPDQGPPIVGPSPPRPPG